MDSDRTDEQLLQAFVTGTRGALGELAQRYERKLLGLACGLLGGRRDLACDAVQETWVRVIRYGRGFDGRSRFKSWLYRIAINECRSLLDLQRRSETRAAAVPGPVRIPPAPDERPGEADRNDALRAAVAELDESKRSVVLLCYHAGMTHEQAAEILELPLGTLKSRLNAALNELRRSLKLENEHECFADTGS